MDSRSRLDYAQFQLTPTRTRCDLLVFSGGITEKVASGLFQPFISHLKFAKDEISKGGYSIALRPPNNDASWFTKATFERFVRFVSTPEVLERFVSLEREILQIDQSFQVNESPSINTAGQLEEGSVLPANGMTRKSTDSFKLQGEFQETEDAVQEENSKIRLQRLLETRKALLRKEQAMVYARALVAGFEMDNIDDLVSFAGAFGASRLREACINFTELCKKKHADGLWMDELAAVQVHSVLELPFFGTSGIVLMNEANAPNQNITESFPEGSISTGSLVPNGSLDAAKSDSTRSHASLDSNKDDNLSTADQRPSTTAKDQVPMQWLNQFPHYMYNFQNHMQQMPPYQGYAYPAIRSVPSYYPRNMESPLNVEESSQGLGPERKYHKSQQSSKGKKEKFPNKNGAGYSGEDSQTEYSESGSGRDIDSYVEHDREHPSAEHASRRRQRMKSSRTVVIRNINYINSKKRDGENNGLSSESSMDENEFIDADLLQQKVEEVVGSLKKHRKPKSSNNNKVGEEKSHYNVNGSNGAAHQDFDNHLIADASERVKRNENWDTFQNLLMRDKEITIDEAERQQPVDVQDEHFTIRSSEDGVSFAASHVLDLESKRCTAEQTIVADSFIVTEREGGNEGGVRLEDFENEENLLPRMKRRDYADEELLFPQRLEESGSDLPSVLSDRAANSSIIKNRKGEDWFISNHSGKSENLDGTLVQTIFDNDHVLSSEGQCMQTEKSRKGALVDDSFMVQARSANDLFDSQWKTDISMIADLSLAAQPENESVEISQDMHDASRAHEPDDLCMILARDSGSESARESWDPKIDYGIDISFVEADKRCSNITANDDVDEKLRSNCKTTDGKNRKVPGTKDPSKETESRVLRGSLGKSKSEITSKSKKPSAVSRPTARKSKLEEEEEIRKKMEELSIQRQKRISERTAANGLTPASLKKVPAESKTKKASIKSDKNRAQSTTRGMN